jgi:hypothetical protein
MAQLMRNGVLRPSDFTVDGDSFRSADAEAQALAGYVYVIVPSGYPFVKVGVAVSPITRLSELQCGCWAELSVKRLVGVLDGSAVLLEKAAHRELRARGHGYRGEWFECGPDEAVDAILTAAGGATLLTAEQARRRRRAALREQLDRSEAERIAQMRVRLGMD